MLASSDFQRPPFFSRPSDPIPTLFSLLLVGVSPLALSLCARVPPQAPRASTALGRLGSLCRPADLSHNRGCTFPTVGVRVTATVSSARDRLRAPTTLPSSCTKHIPNGCGTRAGMSPPPRHLWGYYATHETFLCCSAERFHDSEASLPA